MAEQPAAAAQIREWMLGVLERSGMSPAAWAKKAGVAGTTVQRAIKPSYEFMTSSRTLAKLAEAARVEPPSISKDHSPQLVPQFLPVRYRVQAGLWYESDGAREEAFGTYPVVPDPRYAEWKQWLEEVNGDSADKLVRPGGFVHVVDAVEMGYAPQDGHWVIVERRREGGLLRERTIKQVEIHQGRVTLWPRSSNPRWSDPIDVLAGTRESELVEVEIVGLVIGTYSPLT